MNIKILYFLVLVFFAVKALYAQDQEEKSDKNAFSLNGDIHYAFVKEMPQFHQSKYAFHADYHRSLFRARNFGITGEFGLGLKSYEGELEMRFDKMAIVFLTANYLINKHRLDFGFGSIVSFEYALWVLNKLRYNYNFNPKRFVFISVNPACWYHYYERATENGFVTEKDIWFWEAESFAFIFNIGIGFTF